MWWVLNKIDRESRMATPATWHMRPNVVGIPTIEIRQKLFNQVGYRKGVEIINKKMINGKHGKEYVYSFELLPAFNKIYDEFERKISEGKTVVDFHCSQNAVSINCGTLVYCPRSKEIKRLLQGVGKHYKDPEIGSALCRLSSIFDVSEYEKQSLYKRTRDTHLPNLKKLIWDKGIPIKFKFVDGCIEVIKDGSVEVRYL